MKINVRIFGELVPILGRRYNFELDKGDTISILSGKIAKNIGMKRQGYLGKYRIIGDDLAILVNGMNIDLLDGEKTILQDGDEVVILSPAVGG